MKRKNRKMKKNQITREICKRVDSQGRAKIMRMIGQRCGTLSTKMIIKKKPTRREENNTWEGSLFEGTNRLGNIATFHCDFPPAPISCNLILCQS
jgi:hypothetical protein